MATYTYRIDPDDLERVKKEIKADIIEAIEEEIKKKIHQRAYKTGRLMRSVESQQDGEEIEDEAEIGSDVIYSAYVDRIRHLFNPDSTIDKAFDKLFG